MKHLYGIFLLLVLGSALFVTLLLVNLLQMASMILLPVSARLVRRINRACAAFWWSLCAFSLEHVRGIRMHFSGDDVPDLENALVMANHQSMADIPALFTLAVRKKRVGDMKWFVKDVIKYVPGVGWGMLFLDCVFVKRDWHKDKSHIRAIFKKFHQNDIAVWLMTFPEGTRFREHKREVAQQFARSKNLPVLDNVLFPRVKGVAASLEGLSMHIHAVYDVTIGYPVATTPTLADLFLGNCPDIHLHVRRFEIDQVPDNSAGRERWLIDIYKHKDALLANFKKQRHF